MIRGKTSLGHYIKNKTFSWRSQAALLDKAIRLVNAAEDADKQLREARLHDWNEGVKKGVIPQDDGEKLAAAHEAIAKVIEVDDFAPEALSPIYKKSADVHQFFQELGEQRAAS